MLLTEAPLPATPQTPLGVRGPRGQVQDEEKDRLSSVKREQKHGEGPPSPSGCSVSPVCWVFSLYLVPCGHKMATVCALQANLSDKGRKKRTEQSHLVKVLLFFLGMRPLLAPLTASDWL